MSARPKTARWGDTTDTPPETTQPGREGLDVHGQGFITPDTATQVEDDESVVYGRVAEAVADAPHSVDFTEGAAPPRAEQDTEPETQRRVTAPDKQEVAALQGRVENWDSNSASTSSPRRRCRGWWKPRLPIVTAMYKAGWSCRAFLFALDASACVHSLVRLRLLPDPP